MRRIVVLSAALMMVFGSIALTPGTAQAKDFTFNPNGDCEGFKVSGFEHWGLPAGSVRDLNAQNCQNMRARVTTNDGLTWQCGFQNVSYQRCEASHGDWRFAGGETTDQLGTWFNIAR